jgi:undecaprenyl-diphosphatase
MSIIQALILGIVQGATEFLPISSSGHLVLVPWIVGWEFNQQSAFIFDVLVQWGTLAAVIVYFRADLWNIVRAAVLSLIGRLAWSDPQVRKAWLVVLASLPAALLGIAFKEFVSDAFKYPLVVSFLLLVTAGLLQAGESLGSRDRSIFDLKPLDAIIIGLAQSAALFPGISRSGSTIAGGLSRHLSRPEAARFSFIMAVPVMLGAGLVAIYDLTQMAEFQSQLGTLLVGFLAAAVVGYLSIRWLLGYLGSHSMRIFIIYCSLVGLGGIIVSALRG